MDDIATYPVSVVLLPQCLPSAWSDRPAMAVVIDTLRFTSTAAVALENGAQAIWVVSDIEHARRVASQLPETTLLCGERHCVRIAGFHLGNSPAEYSRPAVADRELVFSTTNGTVAVDRARTAQTLLLGSLLNRAAVARTIARTMQTAAHRCLHVWLVCAGTDGQVALEDVLTAGAILQSLLLVDPRAVASGDSAYLALDAWSQVSQQDAQPAGSLQPRLPHTGTLALQARLEQALGGRNLIESGFAADLAAVAKLDSLNVVPIKDPANDRFIASH